MFDFEFMLFFFIPLFSPGFLICTLILISMKCDKFRKNWVKILIPSTISGIGSLMLMFGLMHVIDPGPWPGVFFGPSILAGPILIIWIIIAYKGKMKSDRMEQANPTD